MVGTCFGHTIDTIVIDVVWEQFKGICFRLEWQVVNNNNNNVLPINTTIPTPVGIHLME